ncbi:MAG: apolipoprotein N-acyltransferase [Aeromonadaceae bacterium]
MTRLVSLTTGWRAPLIAALLGAATVPAFAPWNIWPLALATLVGFNLLLPAAGVRRTALLGFSFAFGLNLPGLWWIHISMTEFGGIPLPVAFLMVALLSAYLALYPALACGLLAKLFPASQRQAAWLRPLVTLPALWLLSDWAMGHLLTGFPWLWFGYSQIDSPLVGIAPLLGVQGVTLALLLAAGAISLSLRQRRPLWLLLPLALYGAGGLLQRVEWTQAGKPVKFALMQGNIPQAAKWDPKNIRPTLLRYLDMSREHQDAAIMVWPESAIPALENDMQPFLANMDDTMRFNKVGFITGIQYMDPKLGRFYNGLISIGQVDAAGEEVYRFGQSSRYYKSHLLPIGEFVPFGNLLRPIAPFFNLPMSSFSRGDVVQPNLQAHGYHFAPAICYEMAFSDELRQNVHADTDYLLTVSNDTWFGTSHGPWQHMEITRMRAIEFGKPLIRATNSGVTVAFDGKGKQLGILPQFKQEVLRVEVAPAKGQTPYNRIGSWPLFGFVALGLLASFWSRRKSVTPPDGVGP